MNELSKKYNIPSETVNKMIKDGIISCSWPGYEQVYELWKQGKTQTEIADITHMTDRNVRYILKKFQ
jgi:DNA-binding transcriptional regulator LsrR (DeoR family)